MGSFPFLYISHYCSPHFRSSSSCSFSWELAACLGIIGTFSLCSTLTGKCSWRRKGLSNISRRAWGWYYRYGEGKWSGRRARGLCAIAAATWLVIRRSCVSQAAYSWESLRFSWEAQPQETSRVSRLSRAMSHKHSSHNLVSLIRNSGGKGKEADTNLVQRQ